LKPWAACKTMAAVKIGLQLYTVRDELAKDFRGTLERVAAMGYREIGYGGTGNLTPEGFKALCAELGLVPLVGGLSVDALEKDPEAAMARHAAIGATSVMLGWLPEPLRKDVAAWTATAKKLNTWGRIARDAGLVFQYHNHDMEFAPQNGGCGLDLLLAATDPALVKFQLDVGWVRWAGQDPLVWLDKIGAARLRTIHLKDCVVQPKKEWIEVGKGVLDTKAVLVKCRELGVEGALIEQDTCARPPLDSARISLENVRKLGF
jgi:sugar phosphate isomerase/epimerase